MPDSSYGQFCPVAMASQVLCTRWTMLVLRELACGSTRFNELRRGVPRMSPALLSKRLKELEAACIVARTPIAGEPGVHEYRLTEAGWELKPIVEAFGNWGQRWIESRASLEHLDATLLMWDMRRWLDPDPMPARRTVIEVLFSDAPPAERRWWLIVAPGEPVDLCWTDPGHDVDLHAAVDLRTMTEIWMGRTTVAAARAERRLHLAGSRKLEDAMQRWLGLNPFAKVEKRVA